MQAISTRYLGPTNSHGGRILAKAAAGRITVPYDHSSDIDKNHEAAARALISKLAWNPVKLAHGVLADEVTHVFVMLY